MKKEYAPHQQRVIEEREVLQDKITKISDFVTVNKFFDTLPDIEKIDMRDQLCFMCLYLEKLDSRISRF
ncbi:hypothetical protein [uncultured Empedobacter sp.]|uniref:crAss001_48 related protein n=1 Tax=uncultured Empedobacter sp. TaxID=410844 RepID=UPI0025DDC208|nr:hypothetical protein [uncultured Empedobacter sp.]